MERALTESCVEAKPRRNYLSDMRQDWAICPQPGRYAFCTSAFTDDTSTPTTSGLPVFEVVETTR